MTEVAPLLPFLHRPLTTQPPGSQQSQNPPLSQHAPVATVAVLLVFWLLGRRISPNMGPAGLLDKERSGSPELLAVFVALFHFWLQVPTLSPHTDFPL